MAIPDYQAMMLPLLRFAADGKEHTFREAVDSLANEFNLTEEERSQLLPSGAQFIFPNRVGWARTYMNKAALIESPRRGNLKITNFIDIRFVPSLEFSEKRLVFEYGVPNDSTSTRSIESIYMHLPLQLKFKSERIKNFRFYGLLGGKFDYDLAANARSHRPDEFLKVSPVDLGYEIGVGFEFYNPNFIFSPEIKLSQGLLNQLHPDAGLPLSNAIQSLHTRTVIISIHLEG